MSINFCLILLLSTFVTISVQWVEQKNLVCYKANTTKSAVNLGAFQTCGYKFKYGGCITILGHGDNKTVETGCMEDFHRDLAYLCDGPYGRLNRKDTFGLHHYRKIINAFCCNTHYCNNRDYLRYLVYLTKEVPERLIIEDKNMSSSSSMMSFFVLLVLMFCGARYSAAKTLHANEQRCKIAESCYDELPKKPDYDYYHKDILAIKKLEQEREKNVKISNDINNEINNAK